MIRSLSSLLLLVALGSASCQKEKEAKTPIDSPKELLEKAAMAEVSIASVSILEDCPDAEADSLTEDDMADQDREADGDGYGGDMPCSQSSMQIAITGQGAASSKLAIKTIRLLGPKGQTLGTLAPRAPTIWKAAGYAAWDEMILPKTDVKASYKLSVPNWNEVQQKLEGSTYGPLYRLEADIMIGETTRTVRSAEVVREQTEMIDT